MKYGIFLLVCLLIPLHAQDCGVNGKISERVCEKLSDKPDSYIKGVALVFGNSIDSQTVSTLLNEYEIFRDSQATDRMIPTIQNINIIVSISYLNCYMRKFDILKIENETIITRILEYGLIVDSIRYFQSIKKVSSILYFGNQSLIMINGRKIRITSRSN